LSYRWPFMVFLLNLKKREKIRSVCKSLHCQFTEEDHFYQKKIL
jgi:hypothetical protein